MFLWNFLFRTSVLVADTKGIHTMHIGELENKDILAYHQKGKIEALKAAQQKATYLGKL